MNSNEQIDQNKSESTTVAVAWQHLSSLFNNRLVDTHKCKIGCVQKKHSMMQNYHCSILLYNLYFSHGDEGDGGLDTIS